MSDLHTQTKVRRLERAETFDRRLAIAALAVALLVGGLTFWTVRLQSALTRTAEARQGWSELMLRTEDQQLGKAKRTLRAFAEQAKRMPDALRERNGMEAWVAKASTRCLALYAYATSTLVAGSVDDCPPKAAKPEDKERYYSDVDLSRQLIKSFYEKLMLLDQQDMISEPVRQRLMRDGTVEFLTSVWLPIEKGLNHVLEKDADAKDKNAQGLCDWYAERVKKIKGEPRAPSVTPETSFY